jgi:hypothetical protein
MKKQILITFLFLAIRQLSFGQLQFKIAYDASYFNPDKINTILSTYNAQNDLAISKFKPVRTTSGLEVGVRYKMDIIAIEGSLVVASSPKRQEVWTDASRKDKKFQSLNVSNQNFSTGLSFHFGKIGFGAAYGFNYFNVSRKFNQDSKRNKILAKSLQYNSINFFLNYEGKMNNNMSFALRPYFQLPLGTVDLTDIQKGILPNAGNLFTDGNEQNMTRMGLKLLFFNGRQAD